LGCHIFHRNRFMVLVKEEITGIQEERVPRGFMNTLYPCSSSGQTSELTSSFATGARLNRAIQTVSEEDDEPLGVSLFRRTEIRGSERNPQKEGKKK
jgi:hypothetical protein